MSIVKGAKDGMVKLYRAVSSAEYDKIMEQGLNKLTYLTTDISEALSYLNNKGLDGKLLSIEVPLEKFINMVANSSLIKGSHGEEFTVISNAARQVINKLINKN